MAEVTLAVGGRSYRLACRDGEEAALLAAGRLLESRVAQLVESQGNVAEARLLLMAALLLAGELHERDAAPLTSAPKPDADPQVLLASRVAALAARAEALAAQLEDQGTGRA